MSCISSTHFLFLFPKKSKITCCIIPLIVCCICCICACIAPLAIIPCMSCIWGAILFKGGIIIFQVLDQILVKELFWDWTAPGPSLTSSAPAGGQDCQMTTTLHHCCHWHCLTPFPGLLPFLGDGTCSAPPFQEEI